MLEILPYQRQSESQNSTSENKPVICWFREDLRISDNPALNAACETGREVICLYIYETDTHSRQQGGATKYWLHSALKDLSSSLAELGSKLHIMQGNPAEILPEIVQITGACTVVWNRRYNLAERESDAALKTTLIEQGLTVQSFNGHLLYEPWEVKTQAGTPMKVFTPFWRAARALRSPAAPLVAPMNIQPYSSKLAGDVVLSELNLLPTKPDWSGTMQKEWKISVEGAKERLEVFLNSAIKGYGENRNLPGRVGTSKLSPYLRFGQISVRQIWAATMARVESGALVGFEEDVRIFLSELGWREFSYQLLFNFPTLPKENFQPKFDAFPWASDATRLKAWQRGQTGYPIVDAGMRELWQTGWMHNRVRMVVGSFLVKHLLIDWREGEKWFWDTLLDADVASNSASWQWIAGTGADAAPYFRIFNPVTQGEKFDADGAYIKRFVPELAQLPIKYLHKPWTAPLSVLASAGLKLGTTYPQPIIDHDFARNRALDAFKSIGAPAT